MQGSIRVRGQNGKPVIKTTEERNKKQVLISSERRREVRLKNLLCGYRQYLAQTRLVESDDDLITDDDHRHAHLAGLFDHFLTLREVARHVEIGEFNMMFREKILRRMAKVAGRGRINGD